MNYFARLATLALLIQALPLLAQHPRLESGPATLLSSSPVYTAASGAQRVGTAVPTDSGWITVWADDILNGFSAPTRRLLATRLQPDGTARDTIGIRFSSDVDNTRFTAVADAQGARAYWVPADNAPFTVHTLTISDEGELSEAVAIGDFPDDAAPGTFTAAVSGDRTALRLHRYAMILDGTHHLKTIDLGGFGDPSTIVAAGSHFVTSWVASDNILMRQTLDLDGNAVGPAGGSGVAAATVFHDLATDGTMALFVWSDASGIYLGLLDPATGEFVQKGAVTSEPSWPRAVWTGSSYLVTWMSWNAGALLGHHVSRDGQILDAEPVRIYEDDPGFFALVARGSQAMLLRQTGGCIRFQCEMDVYATPVGEGPQLDHLISAAARTQEVPSVASNGRNFLVVWAEQRQLFATETEGRSRAPTAPIALGGPSGNFSVAASDGTGYVVASTGFQDEAYSVEGRILIPSNDTYTVKPVSIPQATYVPSNVSAGGSPGMYLLSWREGDRNVAVRIGSDGSVLDIEPITLLDSPYAWASPSIAFDGVDFIVTWSTLYGSVNDQYLVRTVKVGRNGTVTNDRLWSSTASGNFQGPAIGCGDGTCLIVWGEAPSGPVSRWRIVGQRFSNSGALVDAIPFDIDSSDRTQTQPSVSWDGKRFVVNWRKYFGDVVYEKVEFQVVAATGEAELGPLDLEVERNNVASSPVTACNLDGRCIFVEPGLVDDTVLGRSLRLFKRFFGAGRYRGVRR